MGHVRSSLRINAPPERVFEIVSQAERLCEWLASVVEVTDITGPLDQPGSQYTAVLKLGGRRLESRWTIKRVERPTYIQFTGTAPGGGRAVGVDRMRAAPDGTEFTIEIDYELPGGFVGGMADRIFVERAIERDLRYSTENLKALVEEDLVPLSEPRHGAT